MVLTSPTGTLPAGLAHNRPARIAPPRAEPAVTLRSSAGQGAMDVTKRVIDLVPRDMSSPTGLFRAQRHRDDGYAPGGHGGRPGRPYGASAGCMKTESGGDNVLGR